MSAKKRSLWIGSLGTLTMILVCIALLQAVNNASAAHSNLIGKIPPSSASEQQLAHAMIQKLSKHTIDTRTMTSPGNQGITTIPYWTSSFTYQGQTYRYTMAGTDPSKGSRTTTIPTVIIPIDFTFATGEHFKGSDSVSEVLNSAIYKPTKLKTGTTQYGDEIQRAEFWNDVSKKSKDYHLLLKNIKVLPTVKVTVPADKGALLDGSNLGFDVQVGQINGDWFNDQFSRIYNSNSKSFPTGAIPIFLTGSILTTSAAGFHSYSVDDIGQHQQLTPYIYSGYYKGTRDLSTLSHEVAELFNDPFLDNSVPAWEHKGRNSVGCSTSLEVGDPLSGEDFEVNGHDYQDIAFLPWFARQSKSTSLNGQYTYENAFKTYSPPCTSTPVPTVSATPTCVSSLATENQLQGAQTDKDKNPTRGNSGAPPCTPTPTPAQK